MGRLSTIRSAARDGELVTVPVERSLREALAAAITEAGPLRKAADETRAAVERARGRLVKFSAAHAAAQSDLAAARERAVTGITQADDEAGPSALRPLRQAEAESRDDVEVAREGLVKAEAAMEAAVYSADRADRAIGEAADRVIAAEASGALAALNEAHLAHARAAITVRRIYKAMNVHDGNPHHARIRMQAENTMPWPNSDWAALGAEDRRIVGTWDQARAALLTDPDAPLPAIG